MLIKDKDILVEDTTSDETTVRKPKRPAIKKENMRSAWGDAFDYYLRGITERYLKFFGRATRLEFWGFSVVSGILFFLIYPLGIYVDIPLLAYYFGLATLIPFIAVMVRRLHDVNKNAFIYLGSAIIILISALFIKWFVFIPLLLWAFILVRLLSVETDLHNGLYGEPNENDEIYGDDNIRIIRKFRTLALLLLVLWGGLTYIDFDNWAAQTEYQATNEAIMEKLEKEGKKAGLSEAQILLAQNAMKQTLRAWQGQTVEQGDILKAIQKIIETQASSLNQ